MVELWAVMTGLFGARWRRAYGDATTATGELTEAAAMWGAGIRGLTPRQLRAGLERLVKAGGEWPPALPEFLALVRGGMAEHLGPAYRRNVEVLGDPDRPRLTDQRPAAVRKAERSGRAAPWLAQCRARLTGRAGQ